MLKNELPVKLPHKNDHIELILGAKPPSRFPYFLSNALESEMESWIVTLGREFILPSSSPFTARVLLITKEEYIYFGQALSFVVVTFHSICLSSS